MVHIDLNIKRGLEQQRFLDYLNSRLSPRMSTSRGAAGFSEDGTFESVVTGPFSIDEDQIELSWAYRKSADGELLYIEIQEVLIESGDVKWEDAVHKLVIGALTSALELKRNQFFLSQCLQLRRASAERRILVWSDALRAGLARGRSADVIESGARCLHRSDGFRY